MSDSLPLLFALVRFKFTKDLLVDDPASLSPRAYTAPFTYDLKLPIARLAVAGSHGDVVNVHGVERDTEYEIECELLRLVPIQADKIDLPPPFYAPPISDVIVANEARAKPQPDEPPTPPMIGHVITQEKTTEE